MVRGPMDDAVFFDKYWKCCMLNKQSTCLICNNQDDKLQYKLIWQIINMFVILTAERNVTALLMLMNFANEY